MDEARIGFLGLGAMGGPMARRLLAAGRSLTVYDPDDQRLAALAEAGAEAARGAMGVAFAAPLILCSLRSDEQFGRLAREVLLPAVRSGQVVVNLGTARAAETRRLAGLFSDRRVDLIDAPVSGGPGGAEAGTLRIFLGGPRQVCEALGPVLEVLGDRERIIRCGEAGSGQIVKGVNQLAMGLRAAAAIEAVVHGIAGGTDVEVIRRAVGDGGEGWRRELAAVCDLVAADRAGEADTKVAELAYFLADASEGGWRLPLAECLEAVCGPARRRARDSMGRAVASYYHELLRAAGREE